jgi:hypothetical protein
MSSRFQAHTVLYLLRVSRQRTLEQVRLVLLTTALYLALQCIALPIPNRNEAAAIGRTLPPAWLRGRRKEADMAIRLVPTHLHAWWQSTGISLPLLIVLFLVVVAALAFAARTPWVLDQPMQSYEWSFVP